MSPFSAIKKADTVANWMLGNPFMRSSRKVAGFEERDDPIFAQALRFGIAFDMFFDDIEPTQAAADRSDPKHPGTILEQCADLKGVDGMRNGEFGVVVNNLNTIPVVFVQSPVETSDPDVSVIVLRRDPG